MEFKLILKKINNTLSEDERKIFDAWYHESEEHRMYFHRVKELYPKRLEVVDLRKGWDEILFRMENKRRRFNYFKYAAAAAVFIIVGSLWFFYNEKIGVQDLNQPPMVLESLVEIGTDKAILTLEDGSQIALEKGKSYETDMVLSNGEELAYKSGNTLSKRASAKNVLTIPRGGQFFVVLADGTKVWINSDTQLKYPVAFAENKPREIELVYGEAYFEVSPSTNHNGSHFIVHTEEQQVEVLGTEFNIKAYQEDNIISTSLVEGNVSVTNQNTSKNLTPGNQSILNRTTKKLAIAPVDIYDEVSWKNGFFSFKKKSLEEIMKVLSRWYDVEVVFQNEDVKFLTFNGIFRKTEQIDEILYILKNTNEVNYTINGKTIIME